MLISKKLCQNEEYLSAALSGCDAVFCKLKVKGRNALLIYIDALTDAIRLGDLLLRPLKNLKRLSKPQLIAQSIPEPNVSVLCSSEEVVKAVLEGCAVIIIDGYDSALAADVKKYDCRAIAEPPTAAVIKGPREGFTESVKTNLSMLRRRLKTNKLRVERITVGRLTKTEIVVCYISSIADDKTVNSVKERVKNIDIDGIIDSSYIAKLISEHPDSVFKQTGGTEKPDILCAKMLEGRVGVFVDGSPIALTVPYTLIEDFQSSEDYYQNTFRSNMTRILRFISVFIALFLPSVFVSAQLFHLQIIPLNFLLTIVNSIKGIPLSPSLEMFFTLLIFEILNEASIRMPKYVGMAVSIVGALVLGDTAVRAGIVSTPTIMIMALSGICLYTVPELVDSTSFLRLIFLLVAGSVGGFGIILLCCFLAVYLASLENFDTPFLAPFAPLVKNDLKDGAYITFIQNMTTRPETLKPKNKTRMKI